MQYKILAEPVFVGRKQELTQLGHYLTLAIAGKGTTVFISGEAGTGKTRLINEFLKQAKKKKIAVLSGWCLRETMIPYFPFVEAFDAYFKSLSSDNQSVNPLQVGAQFNLQDIPQVKEDRTTLLFTEPRPVEKTRKIETFSSHVWKDQAYVTIAKTLHSISDRIPIILYIEDIHWADSASLALLHYLTRVIDKSEQILIIATFRSEELTTDAEGHPHPLFETLRLMRREDLFREIQLSNLNPTNVSKIAEKMIGGSLQKEFAEKLTKESRGNVLFIVESLRMLSEQRSLIQENNKWRLTVDALGIPSKVKDIILRRLVVLKYNQRRVLDAASVIGEKFDLELLSRVLGLDSLEILETLNIIAHSTSLVCAEGNFYKFDHAMSQETLYEELSLPLKRGYHAKIAEILESNQSGTLPNSDLAHHYSLVGNTEKAIKYSMNAGKDAIDKFSNSQAILHFNYVLQTLDKDPKYDEQKDMALEGLGDALFASNKFEKAVKTFENITDSKSGAVKPHALIKAMFASFFKGDLQHIVELVRRAEENSDLDRLERAHLLHFKTFDFSFADINVNYKLIEESLRIFEEEYAVSEAAWLLFVAAGSTSNKGEMEKALAMGLRSIAIYEDLGDYRSLMEAYTQTGGGNFSSYAFYPEALGMLEKVFEIEQKTKMGNYVVLAGAYVYSAKIVGLKGDFTGAVARDLKALEYLEKAGSNLHLFPIYSDLIVNYVKLEDISHAEDYFTKLITIEPPLTNPFVTFPFNIAKAVYYAGTNQWDQSTNYFNEMATDIVTFSTYSTHKYSYKTNLAWALDKQGKSAEAKRIRQDINKMVEGYAEKVKHPNVILGLMTPINVIVGQTFEARLDIVNVSRAKCAITEIKNLLPSELKLISIPTNCTTNKDVFKLKEENLGPFSVKTVTICLRASKTGAFKLNPQVTYIDELEQTRTSTTRIVNITAKPAQPTFKVLPGRISTGYTEIDRLLFGGIPENYAVVVTGSPCDEREKIVKNFLERGIDKKEIVFHITTEAVGLDDLLKESNFYLFLCNPKPKTKVPDLPNIYKLRSKTDLTNLSISLAKAFRKIDSSKKKRICVETISNVLLDFEAKATTKWISELITDLESKGFTMLAVMDPEMHPSDQSKAVLNLFDGEITITQNEDPLECKKSIRVKKLRNQDFIKNPICLTKAP